MSRTGFRGDLAVSRVRWSRRSAPGSVESGFLSQAASAPLSDPAATRARVAVRTDDAEKLERLIDAISRAIGWLPPSSKQANKSTLNLATRVESLTTQTTAPAVLQGSLRADDGTRTHDLLHGNYRRPFASVRACSLNRPVERKTGLSVRRRRT
jgi:hypothetical protein